MFKVLHENGTETRPHVINDRETGQTGRDGQVTFQSIFSDRQIVVVTAIAMGRTIRGVKLFGSFRLDTLNHCLWRGGSRVPLTPKAFDVLRYLVDHPGRVVGQEEILEALWPETYVNPEVIKKYILSIRRVLGDKPDKPVFVETIPRRGYRFAAEVTDEAGVATPVTRAASKGSIVGRETAIAELEANLARASQGNRQIVFVTGEAGIGKTTLVDVFHQRNDTKPDLQIVRGQCVEGFGGKEAYYPVLEALGQLTRRRNNGPILQNLAKVAPTWLIQFPSVVTAEQREALQREILGATRERMVREICEALEALTTDNPLVIVLEDLHWVDASTLDLLSALARRRERAKLLLICTYRPVEVALSESGLRGLKQDLRAHELCHEIALEPLSEADIAEYLYDKFEDSALANELASAVFRQSGGNALFMTAIVQELGAKGLIARGRAKWKLTRRLLDSDPGVPETLQQMLAFQFGQLSANEQQLLKSASAFGDRFSVWAISPTMDFSPSEIEDLCESLAEKDQFIRSLGIQDIGEEGVSAHYEFRHTLYRKMVYRNLSEVNRSRMHRLLGERLKKLCTSDRREVAAEVAMHFERGHEYEQAIQYLLTAADNAARLFAYRDSIQILQHALELVHKVDSGRLVEIELRILEIIGDTQYWLGEMFESARTYERQAARATESGLKADEINALSRLVLPLGFMDPDLGISVAERAVMLSAELNDPVLLAHTQMLAAGYRCVYEIWRDEDWEILSSANNMLLSISNSPLPPYHENLYTYLLLLRGEYGEALRHIEIQSSEQASETANLMHYVFTLSAKTLVLLRSGRLGELLQLVRDGQEKAAQNGNDPWLFIFREAWLRTLVFDFEGARRLCDSVISAGTVYPTAQPGAIARVAQGYAELEADRYDQAIECFAKVRDPKRTPKFFLHWIWRMMAQLGIAEIHLRSGDIVEARSNADLFLESTLSTADPHMQALGWEMHARVAMAEQNSAEAGTAIHNALAVLSNFDVPLAAWRVHATAWDFYRKAEDKESAKLHLGHAVTFVSQIADSFSRTEPLRETFLEAAPVRQIMEGGSGVEPDAKAPQVPITRA
jgi:DNA-binding winged helix-turn-helix (wHTH) protein/tetratricopeptide (TPR) repeat protein